MSYLHIDYFVLYRQLAMSIQQPTDDAFLGQSTPTKKRWTVKKITPRKKKKIST
jgi:hypothetical protein